MKTSPELYSLHLGGPPVASDPVPGLFDFQSQCIGTRIVGILHGPRPEGQDKHPRLVRMRIGDRWSSGSCPLALPAFPLPFDVPTLSAGEIGTLECDGPWPLRPALLVIHEGDRRSVLGVKPSRPFVDSVLIPPGATVNVCTRASATFDLSTLEIEGDFPDGSLDVLDVRIGNQSILLSDEAVPAEIFRKPQAGAPFMFGGVVARAGIDVTVQLSNRGRVGVRRVSCVVSGPLVK